MADKGPKLDRAVTKLQAHIQSRDDRNRLLADVGKRRVKPVEEMPPPAKDRWKANIDYSVPSAPSGRARTSGGATSFHFAFTHVTRQGNPTVDGKPLAGAGRSGFRAGERHAQYIERDGAAERDPLYARPNDAEFQLAAEARTTPAGTLDQAAYIEREGAVERAPGRGHDELPTDQLEPDRHGKPMVFSNISDDPFIRREFWRAVEESERQPSKHSLVFKPWENRAWWAKAINTPGAPATIATHIEAVSKAYDLHLQKSDAERELNRFHAPELSNLTSDECGAAIKWAMSIQGTDKWDLDRAPIGFKSGRGGRIQYRIITELPHELDTNGREQIVREFVREFEALDLPYTAVIHAPDAHNDARNYHLHLIFHDRPAKQLKNGLWDFEFSESYRGSDRKDYVRYPLRQNKVELVANRGGTAIERSENAFIKTLRERFADITNDVLKDSGVERRLDSKSYDKMFADEPERMPSAATVHLGSNLAALEAAGVVTEAGRRNAMVLWDEAERRVEIEMARTRARENERTSEITGVVTQALRRLRNDKDVAALQTALASRLQMLADLGDDRFELRRFDLIEDKAKSRAVKVRETCLQYMVDFGHRRADTTTQRNIDKIRKRFEEAQAHIDQIDKDLAPERPIIDRLRRIVDTKIADLSKLDADTQKLIEAVKGKLGTADKSRPAQPGAAAPGQSSRAPAGARPQPGQRGASADELKLAKAPAGRDRTEPAAPPKEGQKPSARPDERQRSQGPQDNRRDEPNEAPRTGSVPAKEVRQKPPEDRAGKEAARVEVAPGKPPVAGKGDEGKKDPAKSAEKPAAAQAEQAWDGVVNRIFEAHLRVVRGRDGYEVPGLDEAARATLMTPKFARRTQARLAKIADLQTKQIERLGRWIDDNIVSGQSFALDEASGQMRHQPARSPAQMVTLFRNWGTEPEIRARLDAEAQRRTSQAEPPAAAPRPAERAAETPKSTAERLNALRKIARATYPDPKAAQSPELRSLIVALRNVDRPEKVAEYALRVSRNPKAASEAMRLGPELASAYQEAKDRGRKIEMQANRAKAEAERRSREVEAQRQRDKERDGGRER